MFGGIKFFEEIGERLFVPISLKTDFDAAVVAAELESFRFNVLDVWVLRGSPA